MPNTYVVGDKTKEKIVLASKELFYENGYTETTYSQINQATGLNRALIPYHFQSKKQLGNVVFDAMIASMQDELRDIVEGCSPEVGISIRMYAYYRIFVDRKMNRFVMELQREQTFNEEMPTMEEEFFRAATKEAGALSHRSFHYLSHFDAAMERELISMCYYTERKDLSAFIDELVEMEIRLVYGFLGFSKERIDAIIRESKDALSGYRFRAGSDFVVRREATENA